MYTTKKNHLNVHKHNNYEYSLHTHYQTYYTKIHKKGLYYTRATTQRATTQGLLHKGLVNYTKTIESVTQLPLLLVDPL